MEENESKYCSVQEKIVSRLEVKDSDATFRSTKQKRTDDHVSEIIGRLLYNTDQPDPSQRIRRT